jgi:hypothetical protein
MLVQGSDRWASGGELRDDRGKCPNAIETTIRCQRFVKRVPCLSRSDKLA